MKPVIQSILIALMVANIWGCDEEITGNDGDETPSDDTQPIVVVEIIPASDTLTELGGTIQLLAAARNDSGIVVDTSFEWTSSDTVVATVSADGLVTALGRGTAKIIAAAAGLSDTATITAMGPFRSVATGMLHTCATTIDGGAYCWGENELGEFGNGKDSEYSTVPVPVSGGLNFDSLTAGVRFTCGLTGTREAYCWGYNLAGALGDGTAMNSRLEPVAVLGDLTFTLLDAGQEHTCGLTTTGEAYCWGNAGNGRLGITEQGDYFAEPMAVAGGLTFSGLSAGYLHTCGLTGQGEPYCWGENSTGAVGDSTTTDRETPTRVAGGLDLVSISAGGGSTCGLIASGEAYCWGANLSGELGDGTSIDRLAPVPVSGGLSFAAISAGLSLTCGITTDGEAYCWGEMFEGDLGQNTLFQSSTPELVPGGQEFASVSAAYKHACGLTTFGEIFCWGANERGLLGDGTETDSLDPVRVVSPLP